MTIKAAVIGYPIKHSLSPHIHNYWFKRNNLEGNYQAIAVKPEELELWINKLRKEKVFSGINVTIPHKQAIIPLLDEVDIIAKTIGAVNTITIKEGKLLGSNTDAYGFIKSLATDVNGKTAFILGAGGATRAICYGLEKAGIKKIMLTNRTEKNAENLKKDFVIETVPWKKKEDALEGVDILINATALGMVGKPTLDIKLEKLSRETLVADIVYNPLYTKLLKDAKENGNKTITGIGMLLHQAAKSFTMWSGLEPKITDELQQIVVKEI